MTILIDKHAVSDGIAILQRYVSCTMVIISRLPDARLNLLLRISAEHTNNDMPRVSDRQRALKELSQAIETLVILDLVDAEDDFDLLETLVVSRAVIEGQRYVERPLRYLMRAEARAVRVEIVLSWDERHFGLEARMSKNCFWKLVERIKDNEVFTNQSQRDQDPVHHQLLVTLFRLGKYGNGAAIGHTASFLSLGDGTTEIFTWRCLKAIYDLRSTFITWPKAEERASIAARIAHSYIFGNCVGMLDGSLIPVEQRPGIDGAADFYTRKSRYSLNIMAICDDTKRIRALVTGWPGAVNDQRVFDMSPVSGSPIFQRVTLMGCACRRWPFCRVLWRRTCYPRASTYWQTEVIG